MIKIEALTLEKAYAEAAHSLECSVTELRVEVVQVPSSGFLGFFKKSAIIVAAIDETKVSKKETAQKEELKKEEPKKEESTVVPQKKAVKKEETPKSAKKVEKAKETPKKVVETPTILNDTIMPASFVSDQDDEDDLGSGLDYTADYDDEFDEEPKDESATDIELIAEEVSQKINLLFDKTCFNIDKIDVSVYDDETLLVEFKGDDAALLIGKEGYRYKALSYMIFNWINSKYEVQLRLEIAEFLKNQEESIGRYLEGICENVERDGRAQTKILDGVLVQIALRELRERYPEKYVVIRSTRDGLKYIIINDYNT